MNITLHDFPNPSARTFTPGDVVRGQVSFAADIEDTYAILGCQLIITHTLHGRQEVEVIQSIPLARKVGLERGHARTYDVEFTIPDRLNHQGKLFSVRPGLRGYAVLEEPGRYRNVVFRRSSTFYPTSEPWQYRVAAPTFKLAGNLRLLPFHRRLDATGKKVMLVIPSLIATGLLIALGGLAIAVAVLLWAVLGVYIFAWDTEEEPSVIAPTVRLESNGSTLLAHFRFHQPPDDLSQITAGYEVQEVMIQETENGKSTLTQPAGLTEPRQSITLNERGRAIAEHRYLPLPAPGMQDDIGFQLVYVITARSGGKSWRWEGAMQKEQTEG